MAGLNSRRRAARRLCSLGFQIAVRVGFGCLKRWKRSLRGFSKDLVPAGHFIACDGTSVGGIIGVHRDPFTCQVEAAAIKLLPTTSRVRRATTARLIHTGASISRHGRFGDTRVSGVGRRLRVHGASSSVPKRRKAPGVTHGFLSIGPYIVSFAQWSSRTMLMVAAHW